MSVLFSDQNEIAQGISIMAGRILIDSLPSTIEELMGIREGFVVVARLLERGAREGFSWLMERLGVNPNDIGLEQVLNLFISKNGVPSHPFQVFESIQQKENGYVLVTSKCPYLEQVEKHPTTMGVFVGVVAGVIASLGYHVRWLANSATRKYLCRDNPDIIVYMDNNVLLPACHLIVEEYNCDKA